MVSHLPGLGFVYPHKGSVDDELFIHCQVECHVKGFDEGIPAVRVAAEICLGNPSNKVPDSKFPCIDGRDAEKEQIPSRDKCIWIAVPGFGLIHCHCCVGQ